MHLVGCSSWWSQVEWCNLAGLSRMVVYNIWKKGALGGYARCLERKRVVRRRFLGYLLVIVESTQPHCIVNVFATDLNISTAHYVQKDVSVLCQMSQRKRKDEDVCVDMYCVFVKVACHA